MKARCTWVGLAILLAAPGWADEPLAFGDYDRHEFAPARGAAFDVPFRVEAAARISVEIYGPDGHLVRRLDGEFEAGTGHLTWDGRDELGNVVPDEAYTPVASAVFADGKTAVVDPRRSSGGETIDNIPVRIVNDSDIEYRLPVPARVLVRIGISAGPMLHELASWEPRVAGSNIQRWDGRDADGVERISDATNLKILVTAFRLPQHSIVTSGNRAMDYAAYHAMRKWEDPVMAPESVRFERAGQRLSRHAFQSRALSRPPRVELALIGNAKRAANDVYTVTGPVNVRVNVAKDDRWLLERSGYEIAFFVDHEFVAEEVSGYVPLTWRWNPAGVKPGSHTLTVNVSGFVGQVGVKRLRFVVP